MRFVPFLLLLFAIPASGDEVLTELQRRSNIPQPQLNEILKDCEKSQLSMNVCSFRNFIEVDLEMTKVLEETLRNLPESCRQELIDQQDSWAKSRFVDCSREADQEAAGGSMRPMIFTYCETKATERRIAAVAAVSGCPLKGNRP